MANNLPNSNNSGANKQQSGGGSGQQQQQKQSHNLRDAVEKKVADTLGKK